MNKRKLTVHWRSYDSVKTISGDIELHTLVDNVNSDQDQSLDYHLERGIDELSSVSSASFTMSDDDSSSLSFISEVISMNLPSEKKWGIFLYSYLCSATIFLILSLLLIILPALQIYGVNYNLHKSKLACISYDFSNCKHNLQQKVIGQCCYIDTNNVLKEGKISRNDDNAQISIIFGILLLLIAICMLKPCLDVFFPCIKQ